MTSIKLLRSVTYFTSLPFGYLVMLHRLQRIREFNNTELHPYPSQKLTVRLCPVGVMLFDFPVGGDNIWPIGTGIP